MNSRNITFAFVEKIEKANEDFSLFEGAKKILVGLSGGADSTALVLSLCSLREKYGFEVFALHVNHMIRGKEAERDEEFAKNLCAKLGIEFICERVDVPHLSQMSGESLELCARNARYEIFSKICLERSITHVATAHNKCDNAETVLFNLLRGSSAKGLCGIPVKRSLCDGVTLIRPIIYAERSEIEEYLCSLGQDFVTDSTNASDDYTRNYLRHEIIPRLHKVNLQANDSIMRTSRLLKKDEEYLDNIARENLTDDIAKLSSLHESILSRVVIKLFENASSETLTEGHVSTICEKIYAYREGKTTVSLPGSMSAKLYRGMLSFEKDERKKRQDADLFEEELCMGYMFFDKNPYALYVSEGEGEDIPETLENNETVYKKYATDSLYFDTMPDKLFVRNRRDGDKIKSGGMNKSVKRLLLAEGFPEGDRYLVPFISDGERLLLVPAVAKDDNLKHGGKDKCITVTLYRSVK